MNEIVWCEIPPFDSAPTHPVVTWAPSHVESALISEILCYANIVNGFNEKTKRLLRYPLEVTTVRREKKIVEVAVSDDFKKMLKDSARFHSRIRADQRKR